MKQYDTSVPERVSVMIEAADGVPLRLLYRATLDARATIILCLGRSEFIEKYDPIIERYRALGLSVLAFDFRGQGGSGRLIADPMPGHIEDFDSYQLDIDAVLGWLARQGLAGGPQLIAGHSMGGCIATRRLVTDSTPFRAAILTAPMLGLVMSKPMAVFASRTSSMMSFLGQGERYIQGAGPSSARDWVFEDNVLTPDRAEYEALTKLVLEDFPQYAIGGPSWAWLNAAFREMNALGDLPEDSLKTQTLLVLPEDDRLVANHASEQFAARNNAVRVFKLPNSRHEPYLSSPETLEILWAEIGAFIDGVLG